MIKNLKHDYICGRHSGFPLCCVLFFIFVWAPTLKLRKHSAFFDWLNTKYFFWRDGAGYIPCPVCKLRNNVVEVQECDCGLERIILSDDWCEVYSNANNLIVSEWWYIHDEVGEVEWYEVGNSLYLDKEFMEKDLND